MEFIGTSKVLTNNYISFNTLLTHWESSPDYLISYDETSKLFSIPYASSNDYWVSWEISLKTANIPDVPIISLEFSYNNLFRCDYILAPLKTLQIANTSLYHIETVSTTDILSLGLKVIGPDQLDYTLSSDSTCNVAASLFIMGL